MTIEEKIREIMFSEELSDNEKLDSIARHHPDRCVQNRQLESGDAGADQTIERWLSSYRSNATDQTPNCLQRIAAGWARGPFRPRPQLGLPKLQVVRGDADRPRPPAAD